MNSSQNVKRLLAIGIVADESEAIKALKRVESSLHATKDRASELGSSLAVLDQKLRDGEIGATAHSRAVEHLTVAYERHQAKLRETAERYRQITQDAERAKAAMQNARQASSMMGLGGYLNADSGRTQQRAAGLEVDPASGMPLNRSTAAAVASVGGLESLLPHNRFDDSARLPSRMQAVTELAMEMGRRNAEADSYMRQFETSGESRTRRLAEAGRLLDSQVLSAKQYSRAVSEINRQYSILGKTAQGLKLITSAIFSPAAMAGAGVALAYTTYRVTAEYERNMARMRAISGSPGAAIGVANQLRDLSGRSPVSMSSAMQAAGTFIQYGGSAELAPEVVRQMAAITGGDPDSMRRMMLAYSQTQASGRLMGEEVLQMIDSGFNPLTVIADRTGESLVALKKRMEAGGVSAREVAEAFREASSEGGRFGTLLDELANTLPGQMQKLRAEVERAMLGAGQETNGISRWFITAARGVVRQFNSLGGMKDQRHLVEQLQDRFTLFGTTGFVNLDAAMQHMPRVTELAKRDPASLTPSEFLAVGMARRMKEDNAEAFWETRNVTDVGSLNARWREFEKIQSRGDQVATARDYISMVGELGAGNFRGQVQRDQFERFKAIVEADDQRKLLIDRTTDAFRGIGKAEFDQLIGLRYGEQAGIVQAIRQAAGMDLVDPLIRRGATFDELRKELPPEVQEAVTEAQRSQGERERIKAELDFAEAIRQRNEAKRKGREEYRAELDSIQEEIEYRQDLIKLGRQEAEIRRAMASRGLTREEAEALVNANRQLQLMSPSEVMGPSYIAPNMQAGSQQEAAAKAQAQASQAGEEIRLAKEQARLAGLQLSELRGVRSVLDELQTV